MSRALWLAMVVLATVTLFGPTPLAGAHGQGFAVTTFPEDGGVVAEAPAQLEIVFSAIPESAQASITNADGDAVPLVVATDGSENVQLIPEAALGDGIWLVAYDVVFPHPDHGATSVAGGWTFVVGAGAALVDVPPLAVSATGGSTLTGGFALVGYAVTLGGIGALLLANRHQPRLAPLAALLIVAGLAPALLAITSSDDDADVSFARTEAWTETVAIDGFGDVEAFLERTGDTTWSVHAIFSETKPISLRIWAAAVQPTGEKGGTPVNDLAFINTTESGRYDLDVELDAPGRWQVVLLPRDAQFRSTQAAIWIDQPE